MQMRTTCFAWTVVGVSSLAMTGSGYTADRAIVFPKIDRRPAYTRYRRGTMADVPTYDPDSRKPWQMDLRSWDLSQLDLRGSLGDLLRASFDDRTVWPKQLPQEFDRQRIMDLGRNPGLGVRHVHAKGMTGRGVGIAILDQPMSVDHIEFAERLRLYEEINVRPNTRCQMHGSAVSSIAVGKTCGVAPDADLYYIALWTGDWGKGPRRFTYDFTYLARAIRRIMEINIALPAERKIRVVSMQIGWRPGQRGYDEVTAAADEAEAAGLLVVCSCIERVHGLKFHGLGRAPMADPEQPVSYKPGAFWRSSFYAGRRFTDRLLVPMDSRTTASPHGSDEYVFYREGGWSWAMPWIAGMYALAAQACPGITPGQFWSLAMETGHTIGLKHGNETVPFGPIINAVGLVDALRAH